MAPSGVVQAFGDHFDQLPPLPGGLAGKREGFGCPAQFQEAAGQARLDPESVRVVGAELRLSQRRISLRSSKALA